MERCKLCLDTRKIRKSHIIPNAFFKYIKNERSDGRHITIIHSGNILGQATVSEEMLCQECEQKFSKNFEGYAATLMLHNPKNIDVKVNQIFKAIELIGIDYSKLKLFQMSLLWRASVSSSAFYQNVKLTPEKEEKLRAGLYSLTPLPEDELPCSFERIINDTMPPESDRKALKRIIINPKTTNAPGCNYITIVLGGFSIRSYLYLDSSYQLPMERILKDTGVLYSHEVRVEDHELLREVKLKQIENIQSGKCKIPSR